MLELSKIKYAERPDTFRPDCTETIGSLVMHCGITVDNNERIPADYIKKQIAERIWRMAYSDLHQPLMELQMLARHSVQPQHYDQVRELCDKINALLNPPNESKLSHGGGES